MANKAPYSALCIFSSLLIIINASNTTDGASSMQLPVFEPLSNKTVIAGRDATLTCVVDHLGSYKVAWVFVDGQTILTIGTHVITWNPRISITDDGQRRTWSLTIRDVQPDDAGWYMCQVNTDPMRSRQALVTVVEPPYSIDHESSEDMMVQEHANVTLTCMATGNPTPSIFWRREDGEHININKTSKVLQHNGSTLHLGNISRKDMAAYLCIASNGIPPDMTKIIQVTMMDADVPLAPEIELVNATTDSILVKLTPPALAEDTSPIQGYRIYSERSNWEGIEVPASAQTYALTDLHCGSQYNIYASTYNEFGSSEFSETLSTRTKGTKPQVPLLQDFVDNLSSRSITFRLNAWKGDGCRILYLAIEYQAWDQFDWIMNNNNVEPSGNYVIMDLSPATWYNFRITAHNRPGSSIAEYAVTTLTVEGATVPPEFEPSDGTPYYSMGENTLKIPMTLHQENRERLVKELEDRMQAQYGYVPGSVVLLQGGEDTYRPGSGDIKYIFRQESYFHWAFGVLEPGWYGAIDITNGYTILFMPRLPQEYAMWMGHIRTPKEFQHHYQVERVFYVDEMAQVLRKITSFELLTLHGINSDSGRSTLEATFDGISNFTVNNEVLHDQIAPCRIHKTEAEIKVIRYAASVSCAAHREVMSKIRPGMKEYQLESIFQHHIYYNGGCRHRGYTNICGSGPNAAILHYGHAGAPNDRTIKNGDAIMVDMGAEYYGYTSDVSVSYPANGKFTDDHKKIYNAVLAANQAVAQALQPGVSWVQMQRLAYRAMLKNLKNAGLVQGNINSMMVANIGSIFMPHGLGHLLGLDVHDVGGYLYGYPTRPIEAGYRSLRTARLIEENMILTIEPGCYFIDYILDEAFANPDQAKFLVRDEIERFRGFGGVRIEDVILVMANGIENLTRDLPRTVEDIEEFMEAGRRQENECGLN